MAARSNSLSPKDFLSRLGTDDFDTPLTLTGMAKSSETSSAEFLFVLGTRCADWISVPIDLVEHVEVLGSAPCADHQHHRVAVTFKPPKSPEAAAFAALLGSAVKQRASGRRSVRKGGRSGGKRVAEGGSSDFLSNCGCSAIEIDADGRVWELVSVTEFEDGSCICDYV